MTYCYNSAIFRNQSVGLSIEAGPFAAAIGAARFWKKRLRPQGKDVKMGTG
jgi:hypothetical protein